LEGKARKDFKAWEDRLEFHFLSNLPLDKILATVSEAPEKSIVYLTSFSMDVTGRYLRNTEVSQELASYSKAPVFGLVDTMIGHGNIGGSMISFQHIGTKAGELVLDILGGTRNIENIPATMKVPQVYIFDWRQLKHWGLSPSRLPAGSRIINKELTLWDLRYYIIGALIFIIVQSLLIVGLLIQRRRRILAEELTRHKSDELAHVTRIAAMGELTTALAHEINQPLTAVGSNAEAARRFLLQDNPDTGEIREILADIIQDNQRAGDVVRKIRDLVKKGELEQKAIDFNKAIQELILFIHSESILKGLVITTDLFPGLKKIIGDRTQLQQVVLNLVLNSAAAMVDMPLNKRKIIVQTAMQDSRTAKVSIMDSGPGIDDKNIEKIFEAFYTTKKEGLGMGLSISQTIIDAHGGKIQAENNLEGGATVSFTLPCPGNMNDE
jgi:signal transduction histidine kinase